MIVFIFFIYVTLSLGLNVQLLLLIEVLFFTFAKSDITLYCKKKGLRNGKNDNF